MGEAFFRFASGRQLRRVATAAAMAALLQSGDASAQGAVQGVFTRELIIGTHVDLSGPLSPWGKAVRNGLTMAIDEANAAGGVSGRTIKLVVKDDGYTSTRAAAAVRELVTMDRVFAIISPLGTPTLTGAINEAVSRGVPYLFPLSASADSFAPREAFKFALTPSHELEIQEGLRRILNARGPLKVGVLAPADPFGLTVQQGTANELARRGLPAAAIVSFKRGEGEFAPALGKLRAQQADMVVLGAQAEEALAVLRAAGAIGWRPIFLCSSACYAPEFATVGGNNVEGLY